MLSTIRTLLFFCLWAMMGAVNAASVEDRLLTLDDDTEINVEVLRSDTPTELLAIWLIDHSSERPVFDNMLMDLSNNGIEVWRVDLLGELFLERDNETVRTLSGNTISALISEAHQHTTLPIVLISYDRMTLPLLRGVREYQSTAMQDNRFSGSLLYYPNLFGPTPQAGIAPSIDPIVAASNYPVTVLQPALGNHRWRIAEVMEQFWSADAPANLIKLNGARDWFFMGSAPGTEQREDEAREQAIADMPRQVLRLARQLTQQEKPTKAVALNEETPEAAPTHGPQVLAQSKAAPPLSLESLAGPSYTLTEKPGKVMLLSFWATWCPPCVEELPSMNALAADYSSADFEILSVNFQETPEDIKAFLQRVEVDFPILMDLDGSTSHSWNVFSFPSSFILDRQGRLRYTLNKAVDWHTPEIKALLDDLIAE